MSQSKTRVGGSGYTVMSWQGQQLAWLQTLNDTAPTAVAPAQAIQPIDEKHPVEIITAQAVGAGTLQLTFFELWNGPVWAQLPGFEGTNNLLDVLERQLTLGEITCRKIIKNPNGTYRTRVYHNCLDGDTRFLTANGTMSLADAVGTEQMVLGARGEWTPATIEHFGEQEMFDVVLSRHGRTKIVKATAGHRWFRRDGRSRQECTTETLSVGDQLVSVFRTPHLDRVRLSPQGVQAGIVFGDGNIEGRASNSAGVSLWGSKDAQLLKWFPLNHTRHVEAKSGLGGIRVVDMPSYFKEEPPMGESLSYLYGWLAGYFAADGQVTEGGTSLLSSNNMDHLRRAQDVCHLLGIRTTEIAQQQRQGYGGEFTGYSLNIHTGDLREDFYLIDAHRARAANRMDKGRDGKALGAWKVEAVAPAGVNDVFCAVVPDGQAFTLEGNVLTGNCVITDFDESETVNIGSLSLPKSIRVQYTHTSPV